ncbi:MAG: hypothetical protein NTY86_15510 [Deltaproteobacteria bacterium]|nr:hypothetical protein [Deltaproteobacteria bacterium]
MKPIYHFEHVHILSRDPKAVAQYFHKMFDAKIIEGVEADGKPRIDVEMNGLLIFIFVDNLDETAAELKRRGVEFVVEPFMKRPGLKISFIRGPENVRIELLERS